MMGRHGAVLLLTALFGCTHDVEPRPDERVETEDPVELAPTRPGEIVGRATGPVPYSCDLLETPAREAAPAHPLTAELLAAAPIASLSKIRSTEAVEALLRRAQDVPIEKLSSRDRILIQASALRVARSEAALAQPAGLVVRRMALDAYALSQLGSDPRAELEPWFGSAEGWVERKGPSCGPLGAHDSAYAGALAFRTIRTGDKRVLFAQVVALDSELSPHVTPVIGLIELRTGMSADAPACVVEATAEGLTSLEFAALHSSPFVVPQAEQRVGCNSCHAGDGPGDLSDLGREEGGAFRMERRFALLERAEERARELRLLRR